MSSVSERLEKLLNDEMHYLVCIQAISRFFNLCYCYCLQNQNGEDVDRPQRGVPFDRRMDMVEREGAAEMGVVIGDTTNEMDEGVSDIPINPEEVSNSTYRLGLTSINLPVTMLCINVVYVIIKTITAERHLCKRCYVRYIDYYALAGRHDHRSRHFQTVVGSLHQCSFICCICRKNIAQIDFTDVCPICNT